MYFISFHFIYYTFLGPDVSWYYRCLRTTHFQIRLSSRTHIVETHYLEYVHVYIALFVTALMALFQQSVWNIEKGMKLVRRVYKRMMICRAIDKNSKVRSQTEINRKTKSRTKVFLKMSNMLSTQVTLKTTYLSQVYANDLQKFPTSFNYIIFTSSITLTTKLE